MSRGLSVPLVAREEKYEGISPIDSRTPLAFLSGAFAGAFDVDHVVAILAVLGGSAAYDFVVEDKGLFTQQLGDSYGNQLVDLIAGLGGYIVGERMRNKIDSRPVAKSLRGLGGITMHRAVGDWFGPTCAVNREEFDRYARVRVYPNAWNRWLIAKNPNSGDGSIEDFVKDEIEKHINTSWFSKLNYAIVPVTSYSTFQTMIANEDGGKIERISTDLVTKPGMAGVNPSYYMVVFKTPLDAPVDVAWPVVGCVENAEWALTAVANAWTQRQVDGMAKTFESSGVTDTPVSEEKRVEADRIAAALKKLPGTEDTTSSGVQGGVQPWVWIAGAAAVGALYLHSQAAAQRR